MIRKLGDGKYRLYSRKLDAKTGKRRNLGTFSTRAAAEKHEREVQYFKRHQGCVVNLSKPIGYRQPSGCRANSNSPNGQCSR